MRPYQKSLHKADELFNELSMWNIQIILPFVYEIKHI